MISGVHGVIFAHDAERARAFLGDVFGWLSVDAGGGWLLFALPPSELAIHPTDSAGSGSFGTRASYDFPRAPHMAFLGPGVSDREPEHVAAVQLGVGDEDLAAGVDAV
jgi:catechol 2,3-dioxygenase-like lactoylglutathione lyase family enzyme